MYSQNCPHREIASITHFYCVFQNTSLTWSNDASYPDFTECFMNVVLVGIASGYMAVVTPIYLPYLLGRRSEPLPVSKKQVAKLVSRGSQRQHSLTPK